MKDLSSEVPSPGGRTPGGQRKLLGENSSCRKLCFHGTVNFFITEPPKLLVAPDLVEFPRSSLTVRILVLKS